MLKNQLDWYLEACRLIPDNLLGFRRGLGTMECLSNLISPIYDTFCNRQFLTAAFVVVKGAYGSIYIQILILRFQDLNVPEVFYDYI
jgi:hypothetical protein